MTDPVSRITLLEQPLPTKPVASMEVRRITLQPNVTGGAHRHNGPVFGSIERGSAILQLDGGPETVLRAGDVFYEPAHEVVRRFDATDEGVTFLGYFLLSDGQAPQLEMLPQDGAVDPT